MKTVCKVDQCVGCRLCIDTCPVKAIRAEDGIFAYNAIIDENLCINCGFCHDHCPANIQSPILRPISWYQGWSNNPSIRAHSSSGGVATEIAKGFLANGGEICTCWFNNGCFEFGIFTSEQELLLASGSKYVKSDASGIYKIINRKLQDGQRILMIGLPCQIAAVRSYIKGKGAELLYSIDLICHGTPAPILLDLYLKSKGIKLNDLQNISFRMKTNGKQCDKYTMVEDNYMDEYTYAFLKGLTYTENCYSCQFARLERIGDVTLGDSWGSELTQEERNKGISLVLCQTDKGRELLGQADLHLQDVNLEKAIVANSQLSHPSPKPIKRQAFLDGIRIGKSFSSMLWRIEPKRAFKNTLKKYLYEALQIKKSKIDQIAFALRIKK